MGGRSVASGDLGDGGAGSSGHRGLRRRGIEQHGWWEHCRCAAPCAPCPPLVALLALDCQVVGFLSFLVPPLLIPLEVSEAAWPWFWLLWAAGVLLAFLGLILGLMFDPRGVTLPLALLVLLAAIPMAALGFLLSAVG
jgi:hypothetical protein